MANGIELATAYVSLTVDGKDIGKGIKIALRQVDTEADRAGKRAGDKMGSGVSSGILGAAKKLAGPLAAVFAGFKLGQILGDTITAGSDFQQALGGADAVFKGEAGGIKTSAEKAADALGLSKNAYLELATVLGAGLKNKGITDFAGQTEDLITIGADLAAQFGGKTTDAVDAIASAMRGESDPIEKYGISLNEAAVKAEALRIGLGKSGRPLTEQEKTMARLSLITQQAADAQGAFGRESDTFAGKQARLAANWENIKTSVGTALLPALTSLSDWFLTKGLPAIQKFGGWVKDKLWPALKDGWETIQPGLQQAKDIILGAFGGDSEDTMRGFSDFLTNTLIPIIATFVNEWLPMMARQIGAVIEVVKLVWAVFITLRDIVIRVTSVILEAFSRMLNGAADMFEAISVVPGFGWAKGVADKLRGVAEKADAVRDAIKKIPKNVDVEVSFHTSVVSGVVSGATLGVLYPKRELGGPVRKGQPYVVGEKRPELFVPNENGTIVPRVPQTTSAPASMGGFDYWRMAEAMTDTMRQATFAVGVDPVTRAVNARNAARAMG